MVTSWLLFHASFKGHPTFCGAKIKKESFKVVVVGGGGLPAV